MHNVTDLGITPSDSRPGGNKINQLLQKNPGAYHFPEGTYLIDETLRLPSNTHLRLADGAVFKLADGAATTSRDYLLCNADPENGNTDILLEGGCFDGNQVGNPRPEGLFTEGYTGAMIHFENVNRLKLLHLTLANAEAYYSRFTHVHDFHIEDILFDSSRVRPNNDGIHLGGNCSRGVIRNLRAVTPHVPGDDMVALNADDALTRNEVRGMTNGPITDILIEDLEADSCHTFVRLLSVVSPIRNVRIRGLRGGCEVAAVNADGARGCRVPVFDETNPPYSDGVGHLENIDIADLHVAKRKPGNNHGVIDLQERMTNFMVKNFKRDLDRDLCPGAPSLRLRHIRLKESRIDGAPLVAQTSPPSEELYESFHVGFTSLHLRSSCEGPG